MIGEARFVPWFATTLAWLLLPSGPAFAATIDFTSASMIEIAAPASVVEGALEDNDHAFVFAEQQSFLLTSALSVDATNPGADVQPSSSTAVPGTILAGTTVDSFLIHFDSVGEPTTAEELSWFLGWLSADFIVGLIYTDALLDASDYLGDPGTTYPTGVQYRGMTGANEGIDSLLWSQYYAMSGVQSVTVAVDHLRVILAPAPVPEPAGVGLIAGILLALAARRRLL